jgi:hypothetical protein
VAVVPRRRPRAPATSPTNAGTRGAAAPHVIAGYDEREQLEVGLDLLIAGLRARRA